MNLSPEAKRLLQEYAYQREREKRAEAFERFVGNWVWLPIVLAFGWIMWFVFAIPR